MKKPNTFQLRALATTSTMIQPSRSSLIKQGFPAEDHFDAPDEGRASNVVRAREARVLSQPYHLAELPHRVVHPLPPLEPEAQLEKEVASLLSPEAVGALRVEWEAEWQARHGAALEQARAEAYEEGQAAARAELEAEVEAGRAALKEDLERLRTQFRDYFKKVEPLLANLAFDVAQQLLSAPLPQDVRSVSTQALTQALESFRDTAALEIVLHPDDLARLEAFGLAEDLGALHPNVRWKSDDTLELGDWIVQSPEAAVRRLKQELLAHLKNRFGLLSLVRNKDR